MDGDESIYVVIYGPEFDFKETVAGPFVGRAAAEKWAKASDVENWRIARFRIEYDMASALMTAIVRVKDRITLPEKDE